MIARLSEMGLHVFSTCPQSSDSSPRDFLREVRDVARWSEEAGCEGMLIYSDNRLVDPWLVAQHIVANTERLCPLVAVQPMYMHPYTVATMVASIAFMYRRRVYLNMVAGGFRNDLIALGDVTPHDERYARLQDYTSLILKLLTEEGAVTHRSPHYPVTNLRMTPPFDPSLMPGVVVSGSSDAGMATARALGALAVRYPKPAAAYQSEPPLDYSPLGIRIGVVARRDSSDAWSVARARFPENRKGQITQRVAMKVSDSAWHKQLSDIASTNTTEAHPYWMTPFENYATFCPYLVGSYDRVAEELARYVDVGYKTIILDIPPNREELEHTAAVCERVARTIAGAA